MLGICPDTLRLMSLFLINKPFRPALLLVLIFLSGALGSWWLAASAARDVDAETLRVTQLALNQELARERRQLASSLQDYANWDEMADKINRAQPDLAWLNDNLTASVYHNLNVHLALLVDASDGVLLARRNGLLSPQPATVLPLSNQQWLTLLRSTDRYHQAGQITMPSQLLRVDSINPLTGYPEPRILMLSIQRITAEQQPATTSPYLRYLVFARYLDQAVLQQLADGFLLPQVRLFFTPESPPGLSSLPLTDNNGQTLAWLAWPPRAPGNNMLERMLPQSVALLLLILLLGAAIVRMAERWQRQSQQQSARLQQQGAALQNLVTSRRDDQQELREYLEEVIPLLSQTLRVSRISVWQFTPDGKELHCLAGLNVSSGQFGSGEILEQANHSDYFQAMRQQRYLATDHAQQDERLSSLRSYLVTRSVHTMLDAAIMVGGLHHGILCVESQTAGRQWQQFRRRHPGAGTGITRPPARRRRAVPSVLLRPFHRPAQPQPPADAAGRTDPATRKPGQPRQRPAGLPDAGGGRADQHQRTVRPRQRRPGHSRAGQTAGKHYRKRRDGGPQRRQPFLAAGTGA